MNHEKLSCYQLLVKIARGLNLQTKKIPPGYAYLEDQIKRALSSAILNLAEGNEKSASSKDRQRYFQASLGSISESAACLDLYDVFQLLPHETLTEYKSQLLLVYNQIRKLP